MSGGRVLIVGVAGRGAIPGDDLARAVADAWRDSAPPEHRSAPQDEVEVYVTSNGHQGLLDTLLIPSRASRREVTSRPDLRRVAELISPLDADSDDISPLDSPGGHLVALPDVPEVMCAVTGSGDGTTAWLEPVAGTSGAEPATGSTFPLGAAVAEAVAMGARRIVLGVGMSTVGDGGAGFIAGLAGVPESRLARGPAALADLQPVDLAPIDIARRRLAGVELSIAAATTGELLGPAGDWATSGAEREVDQETAQRLDLAVSRFVDLAERAYPPATDLLTGKAPRRERSFAAAAGGGVGYAATLLGAQVYPGAELVAREIGLDAAVRRARLVVLAMEDVHWDDLLPGPLTWLAEAAQAAATPVVVVCLRSVIGRREAMAAGIHGVYPVVEPGPRARPVPVADIPDAIGQRAARVARSWRA